MFARLQLLLFVPVALVGAVDVVWLSAAHIAVDTHAYASLIVLAVALGIGGLFYSTIRKDARLAAMLMATAFLIAMSVSFSVLNYLLLTVAGPRIDEPLAAIDRAMGVDWPAMMAWAAAHPWINAFLQLCYISVLPQIAVVVLCLGFQGASERIYRLCLAVGCGASICMAAWTVAPSFGAFSVYDLPAAVSSHLAVALDGRYAHQLVALLAHGPGFISPAAAKGLIGFPSYHAVLALLVVWYAREVPVVRWIVLGIDAVVMFATPIQGGHHVIDVIAGFAVAALAIGLTDRAARWAMRERRTIVLESLPLRP